MVLTLELSPIQIREAENSLASTRAKLTTTKSRLERCEIKAPFDGRVKEVSLEKGQYVAPGAHVITLANDAILEIQVPLDSQDASKWLRFSNEQSLKRTAWFNGLEKVGCKIYWTESSNDHSWEGTLHRVVRFDQQTRTLTVAIRIEAQNAVSTIDHRLPLVEGMFCSIEIPGRTLRNVFVLPRWSVSFENSVYLSVNNRLKTVPVEVARIEGERAFVSAGLSPGDEVIITRLVDPLENSLLEIVTKEKKEI